MVNLASHAYENTSAPEIKAESCYLKGRVQHAMGSLGEAKLLYSEACNLWPQFPPAQYGMAQILVYEGSIELAMRALDAVLAEVPDNQVRLLRSICTGTPVESIVISEGGTTLLTSA